MKALVAVFLVFISGHALAGEGAEASGGLYISVDGDGKIDVKADTTIPLKDGRVAIMTDGKWTIQKRPEEPAVTVKPIDFSVSWRDYLERRVRLPSVGIFGASATSMIARLPGSSAGLDASQVDRDTLKYLIENCSGLVPGSACVFDVSGVVRPSYSDSPRLIGATVSRPAAPERQPVSASRH